ncbi:uncharacterized protein LOC127095887 [Lathyrus oleraceus]|uniref:uncharacterized protein LOC127095887 n=1 Tax=Pisum sativum TaxID=3888 RepID=UPI0021D36780|nr:uncharacterized protein LOC127095887 [Pisum sativum]
MGLRLEEGVREGRLKEELFSALILKNLVQTKTPPTIPKELPWWYKADQHCALHQGEPDHDIENCFSLKAKVRRLMQSGILSFEDSNPNVQVNPLPKHGNTTVNMVEGCPGKYRVFNVNLIRRSLVEMHATLYELRYYEHGHASCQVCSRDPRGCVVVKRDLQEMLDQNLIQVTRDRNEDEHEVNVIVPRFNLPEPVVITYDGQNTTISPLFIRMADSTPYESDKVMSYKYNATMIEDDKEVSILYFPFVVNIVDVSGVTQSGRIFVVVSHKRTEDVVIEKSSLEKTPVVQVGQSSVMNQNADKDEVLKLIKKSDFNVVDHDEELPEQGKNHNLALHISMNCQEDALSNVLVDIRSSLNVLPKSTLSKLAYQGAPMRFSGVVVKAFDGSRKTIIGEVDLPIKIG